MSKKMNKKQIHEILVEIQNGDESRLGDLVESYRGYFYRAINQKMQIISTQDMQDYMQECAIVLIKCSRGFDLESGNNFNAYLNRSIHNLILELLSHRNYSLCRSSRNAKRLYGLEKTSADRHVITSYSDEYLTKLLDEITAEDFL